MIRNIFQRNQHPTDEDLSAYVDRSSSEVRRFARHIEACEACRDRVTELREVKSTLAQLPRAQTARSFTLGAEHVRVEQRAVSRGPGRLVLAPIASLVILVALVGVDLTAVGTRSSSNDAATANVAEQTKAYSTQDDAGGANRNAGPNVPLTAPAAGAQPEAATGTSGSAEVPPIVSAPRVGAPPIVTPPATGAGQAPPVVTPAATGLQLPPTVNPPSTGAPSVAGPTASASSVPVATPGVAIDTFAADRDESASGADDTGMSLLRVLEVLALGAFVGSAFLVFRKRAPRA